jgi:hypothetical protein
MQNMIPKAMNYFAVGLFAKQIQNLLKNSLQELEVVVSVTYQNSKSIVIWAEIELLLH